MATSKIHNLDWEVTAFPADENERLALQKLKLLLKERHPNLVTPDDDASLLRFLRYRKHDVEETIKAITKLWKQWETMPEIRDNIFENFLALNPTRFCTPLKQRDELGRTVIVWRIKNWDPRTAGFFELFQYVLAIIETLCCSQGTQINGVVCIIDLDGLSMAHVQACTPSVLRTIISMIHGVPLKLKTVHFINNLAMFNTVWTIIKLFLKAKLKKRVQFHGYNFENTLHEIISPEILPKCYGGELEEEEVSDEKIVTEEILRREEYWRELSELKKYGFRRDSSE